MATITIGLSGSAIVNGSKNYALSDAAVTKFIAWARGAYPPPTRPDERTDAQVLVAWADAQIAATRSAVTKVDRDAAVAEAINATPEITIG